MDNLKTLFEKGQFKALIDLTEGSKSPEDLLYRSSAFMALNKPDEALAVLLENRDGLFGFNALATMRGTIGARLALNDPVGAYRDLNDFKNRPYVSQQCEEYMQAAEKEISGFAAAALPRPKKESKPLTGGESPEEILSRVAELSTKERTPEDLEELKGILTSRKAPQQARFLALSLLSISKYNLPVDYYRGDRIFRVVPKDLPVPYTGGDFPFLAKALEKDADSPFAGKVATTLAATYVTFVYPEEPFKPEEVRLYELAFLLLSCRYLKAESDLSALCLAYGLDLPRVESKANEIEALMKPLP